MTLHHFQAYAQSSYSHSQGRPPDHHWELCCSWWHRWALWCSTLRIIVIYLLLLPTIFKSILIIKARRKHKFSDFSWNCNIKPLDLREITKVLLLKLERNLKSCGCLDYTMTFSFKCCVQKSHFSPRRWRKRWEVRPTHLCLRTCSCTWGNGGTHYSGCSYSIFINK